MSKKPGDVAPVRKAGSGKREVEKKKAARKRVSKKIPPAAEEPKKNGRPSKFSEELLERICEGLREGKPLTIVCKEEGMPAPRTVRDWMAEMEEVSAAIACAREEGGDFIAWEILKIADNTGHQDKDTITTDFGDIPNKEWMMRSKLRCDVRLALLAKWHPKRYGTKVEAEITGKDGKPMELTLSPESLEAIAKASAVAATVTAPAAELAKRAEG